LRRILRLQFKARRPRAQICAVPVPARRVESPGGGRGRGGVGVGGSGSMSAPPAPPELLGFPERVRVALPLMEHAGSATSREASVRRWLASQPLPPRPPAAGAAATEVSKPAGEADSSPAEEAAKVEEEGEGKEKEESAAAWKRQVSGHLVQATEEIKRLFWAMELLEGKQITATQMGAPPPPSSSRRGGGGAVFTAEATRQEEQASLAAQAQLRAEFQARLLGGAAARLRARAQELRAEVTVGRGYYGCLGRLAPSWKIRDPEGAVPRRKALLQHVVRLEMDAEGVGGGGGGGTGDGGAGDSRTATASVRLQRKPGGGCVAVPRHGSSICHLELSGGGGDVASAEEEQEEEEEVKDVVGGSVVGPAAVTAARPPSSAAGAPVGRDRAQRDDDEEEGSVIWCHRQLRREQRCASSLSR
jgi:hypothetical protein